MRIFLIEYKVDVANIVNPAGSYRLSKLSDIDHAALTLDQTMFGSRLEFDWVLFTQHQDIKFEEFRLAEKYFPKDSKTILSAKGNSLECFYCRPELYVILGNLNKIPISTFFTLSKQRIDIHAL